MLLPDIITRYPATRAIFDQYGLKGCGGPTGPREAVAWFARLHGVPLESLLDELNEAAQQPQPAGFAFQPSLADTIYRPFFIAGLLTVLSLGCVWGAINLFLLGQRQSFGGVDYSWTLAHGHAMVFGFVGFFIMGFAYQAFPRFKHAALWRPPLAFSALPLMAIGIGLQTIAHLLAPRSPYLPLGVGAGLLQLVAVSLFALALTQTMKRAGKPENYDGFLKAALSWFLLAAVANPVIFWLFESASTRDQFLFRVASFNVPYRDVQLLGIAVVMILGVSLRYLPHAYGLREPSARWRAFLLWGVNGAVAMSVVACLTGMLSGQYWLLAGQGLAALVLLAVALGAPRQFRLFGPVSESEQDRGLKFIRAAYVWFIVAMAMLVLFPVYNFGIYQPMTGSTSPFSHAFFGAYRHALTVGFIMMMIVGVSSKVISTLSGVDPRRAASLWPTFLLLNVGNLARISTEIATDFTPAAYSIMGISGFFEVAGLALWGYELVRNMRVGARLQHETLPTFRRDDEPFILTPQTKVAEVLERYPQTLDVFLRHGFTPLSNPVLRRTMARVVTLQQACRREGGNLDALLVDLQQVVAAEPKPALAGPNGLVTIRRKEFSR
jgi:hypothetical protein